MMYPFLTLDDGKDIAVTLPHFAMPHGTVRLPSVREAGLS